MSTPTPRSKKQRIAAVAGVVMSIEAMQKKQPGYQQDVLESLVNCALKQIETATGQSLDAIAAGGAE